MAGSEEETDPNAGSACANGEHEPSRDILHDFRQATLDLHSYLSQAKARQQSEVTVPTDTLRALLDGVETIKRVQSMQEKHQVASLYVGTILGALIGVVGNFFVSFVFMPQNLWNALGLALSFILLLLVCAALFIQARKYIE